MTVTASIYGTLLKHPDALPTRLRFPGTRLFWALSLGLLAVTILTKGVS